MRLVIGRVGRAHGVRGDVAVVPYTDDVEARFEVGRTVFLAEWGSESLTISGHRWHSGRLLVRFAQVADRTAAEALANTWLYTGDDDFLEESGAWYDHQLVGLKVISAGREVGRVSDVVHLPAQDQLEVELLDGSRRLIPFVAEVVPTVDLAQARIEVHDRPGLLFDEDPDAD